ncbi:TRAP transporter small permease [Vibrio sp. SS-MA-C1-2]|uniref:TRAP transporter small permease n=1 Tax=Vibrio sp. SS-MA-C1-2 TaxID=2908646 RepID=UPI001F3B6E7D|nr:TRAP transporter small permease [Vibrio sp. SS-MA-C1-2]UJF18242.1 TRAP transporter small permease [Vibrio sp. SS-MA-C1-2]UJF18438.1 TRAP transporter small permease [Vibrio sp. SS-MA-C1-2]
MFNKIADTLNIINAPLAKLTSKISGVLLLIMTVIVLLQVGCRYIFNLPLSWTDEASRFLMIYMTYLCLPIIYLQDKNIAMTFITDKVKGSRVYHLMMIFTHVLSLILFFVWIKFGMVFFETGAVSANSLPIPMYVVYIIPPVMLGVSCLYAVQKLCISLDLFIHFNKSKEQFVANVAK